MSTADSKTHADIQETIFNYIQGYLQADGAQLALAFHPQTRLHSTAEDGSLERTEMEDWQRNLNARKEKGDIRTGAFEIAWIDAAGDSAVAKVHLRLKQPELQFTDYLSFLRITVPDAQSERKWLITGKIYTVG